MKKLIEALTIFAKYKDVPYPTSCEHDVLYIMAITQEEVSAEDQAKLEELGFFWSDSDECWESFRYGASALLDGFTCDELTRAERELER